MWRGVAGTAGRGTKWPWQGLGSGSWAVGTPSTEGSYAGGKLGGTGSIETCYLIMRCSIIQPFISSSSSSYVHTPSQGATSQRVEASRAGLGGTALLPLKLVIESHPEELNLPPP